ncbi:MAG TPA: hypothetical protein H9782_05155 [Candidatus Bariatricus faecipullorum]|nr:hypothetical protein [Candidatus Bariatricus faecipullorum]
MKRFERKKQKNLFGNLFVSLALFALVIALFYSGVTSLSERTVSEQKETLETALHRAAVYCYSIEGTYPESLEYLETVYGITYDKSRFFVDYQVLGSNLMPDITVIER